MNFLIKLASRSRPESFKRTIENVVSTFSSNPNNKALILVSLDADDKKMSKLWEQRKYALSHNIEMDIRFKTGESNKIEAINRDVNYVDFNWDVLINLSDDMVFVERNWDEFIDSKIKAIGTLDCFVHISDGYVFDKLPTMSIMGREYYERFFYIYPPCYKSYSCDAEAMFVAQMLGKWHYFSDVLFKHEHPANNLSVNTDETYKRADQHTNHDTEVYFKRMRKLFYVNNPTVIPSVLRNEMEAKGWLN